MNNEKFEPIRLRIMKEAYNLADRGDAEGYNAIKVMCDEVQKMFQREWVGLNDEEKKKFVVAYFFGKYDRETAVNLMNDYEAVLKEKNGG